MGPWQQDDGDCRGSAWSADDGGRSQGWCGGSGRAGGEGAQQAWGVMGGGADALIQGASMGSWGADIRCGCGWVCSWTNGISLWRVAGPSDPSLLADRGAPTTAAGRRRRGRGARRRAGEEGKGKLSSEGSLVLVTADPSHPDPSHTADPIYYESESPQIRVIGD